MPRYMLLGGQHTQADPTKGINPKTKKLYTRTFKPGDVFESNAAVCAQDWRKFRRVDNAEVPELTPEPEAKPETETATATLPQLETMTVAGLRDLARENGIPLSAGTTTKEAIIAAIRAAV